MKEIRLRPESYQKRGAKLASLLRYFLIADEVGLGKSLMAMMVSEAPKNKINRVLIICPASLTYSWKTEIEKSTYQYSKMVNTREDLKRVSFCKRHKYYICSYSKFVSIIRTTPTDWDYPNCIKKFDHLILDEVHAIKGWESIRTQVIYNYIKYFSPRFATLISGTPINKASWEWYPYLRIMEFLVERNRKYKWKNIDPKHYEDFLDRFCINSIISISKKIEFEAYKFIKKNQVKAFKKLIRNKAIRREYEKIKGKKPYLVSDKYIQCKDKITEASKSAFTFFFEAKKMEYMEYPPTINRVMKEIAVIKARTTAELAKNIIDSGETNKIIIFTNFHESRNYILKKLGADRCCQLHGGLSSKKKDIEKKSFECFSHKNYLIATIGAGKAGHNLQFCNTAIFNDYSWSLEDIVQAKGRIDRKGQISKKITYYFILLDKLDSIILNTLQNKKDFKELVDRFYIN